MSLAGGTLNQVINTPGILSILNFTFVPYGNARGNPPSVRCQHGQDECTANMYESCVIGIYPEVTDWWPYVHCIETSDDPASLSESERCTNKTGLNWDLIRACQTNETQWSVFVQRAADRTNSLQPPHEYTPWVTIYNSETRTAIAPVEDTDQLLKLICNAYAGPLPEACTSLPYMQRYPHQALCFKHDPFTQ